MYRRKAGGIGLEKLVCELLRCNGYNAEVLPKNTFRAEADADIFACKEDTKRKLRICTTPHII